MIKTLLLTITLCTLGQSAAHRAWIDYAEQDGQLRVQGKFLNQSTRVDTLQYKLTTVRQGQAGNSQSTQAGRFVAPINKEIVLTQTTVSVELGDTYTIQLEIFRGDTVYIQDQVVH
ncbi:curli-like amyloid fiber formation chaperone CsgH [Tunicatimonas pelagia]|uniref:curli-like amyloid fiber formation chaperone CsgH n=1 Tax=Tunicatimonas pelagia TaxID=931531 RepID=UPI0026658EDC|nr:curli-like amyloid fiber formation chaperone CsgH [Tunicatimonas pelagia]WKN42135.1 curli-like amyloid fiber formation chaperone CsgH [Tunicatimonas pelagia]